MDENTRRYLALPTFTLLPPPEEVLGVSPELLKLHGLQVSLAFADRIRIYQHGQVAFEAGIRFEKNERGGWTGFPEEAIRKSKEWIDSLG